MGLSSPISLAISRPSTQSAEPTELPADRRETDLQGLQLGLVETCDHVVPQIRIRRGVLGDRAGCASATNLAVMPGATKGCMTVNGPDGGCLYAFDGLDEGIRSTNGG